MDEIVLRSAAQFKALGHPVRHQVVNVLRQRPATLGQLASALGSTKGTISYHVRVLRDAGFLHVAESRHVRGGTEQHYALVGRGFRFHEDAVAGPEFLLEAAMAEMLPHRPGEPDSTLLQHIWLTLDEARALAEQLEQLAREHHSGPNKAGEPYGLLLSLFRADIPVLPQDDA